MTTRAEATTEEAASALKRSIGLFVRRLRHVPGMGELTDPEQSTLSRLERWGSTTASDLARAEQVTPQAIGPMVAGLEERGLVARTPDPEDGRRVLVTLSDAGLAELRSKQSARVAHLAALMARDCTPSEVATLQDAAALIERLAERL